MQQLINPRFKPSAPLRSVLMAGAILMGTSVIGHVKAEPVTANTTLQYLSTQLQIGDVVFIRIPRAPFTKVADTTASWTNHVGIVSDVSGEEPVVSESRVPLSGNTTWTNFVGRSEAGRVAVARLGHPLDKNQQSKLRQAVKSRQGILYDTGFDLHSNRQFCSRYVREVLAEAVGVKLGEVENFDTLLQRNPQADQTFWRMWYFGNIPWQRETVTPASLLRDGRLNVYFDGYAQNNNSSAGNNHFRSLSWPDNKGSGK